MNIQPHSSLEEVRKSVVAFGSTIDTCVRAVRNTSDLVVKNRCFRCLRKHCHSVLRYESEFALEAVHVGRQTYGPKVNKETHRG
jgi:hypothetical protein